MNAPYLSHLPAEPPGTSEHGVFFYTLAENCTHLLTGVHAHSGPLFVCTARAWEALLLKQTRPWILQGQVTYFNFLT